MRLNDSQNTVNYQTKNKKQTEEERIKYNKTTKTRVKKRANIA